MQEGLGIAPLNLELAHMTDVEETGARAYGVMFIQNAAVMHRHLPPAKLYQPRAQRAVLLIEGSAFQRGNGTVMCCHTGPLQYYFIK
ncbi:MAG: hypothetical protein NVS2B12_29930 [Ktedonobacteraceae bacterium]